MKYNRLFKEKSREKITKMLGKLETEKQEYPIPGQRYEHYKGGLYIVHFLSKHTETGEILVNYTSLTFGTNYSRPLSVWNSRPEPHVVRFLKK